MLLHSDVEERFFEYMKCFLFALPAISFLMEIEQIVLATGDDSNNAAFPLQILSCWTRCRVMDEVIKSLVENYNLTFINMMEI